MNIEDFLFSLFFFSIASVGLMIGLYHMLGYVSMWYILHNPYITLGLYFAIPGSIFFGMLGLLFYVPVSWQGFIIFTGLFFGVFGPFIMLIPKLKPKWLQWLHNEHGEILDVLRYEIRQDPYWNNKINTQAELEAWVEAVREKRGL